MSIIRRLLVAMGLISAPRMPQTPQTPVHKRYAARARERELLARKKDRP
jgi:hypothetical protein